jgi:putative transposase
MGQTSDIRTGRHCVFLLHAHLVFVTKYRHPVFTDAHLSRLVNSLKGVSSRRLRQEFPELARQYWRARRLWSGSYFAGSVGGAPLNVLRPTSSSSADPTTTIHLRPEGRSPLAEDW